MTRAFFTSNADAKLNRESSLTVAGALVVESDFAAL
jgi:hypothetical protein